MRENLLGDTSQDSQTFVEILILSYEKLAMNDKCLECLFKFIATAVTLRRILHITSDMEDSF